MGGSAELADGVTSYLASRDLARLQAETLASGSNLVKVRVDGKEVALAVGKDVFFSVGAAATAAAVV